MEVDVLVWFIGTISTVRLLQGDPQIHAWSIS
jgi:hypothetical protein